MQTNADRFYLKGRVKIPTKKIEMFKKWNMEYPHSLMEYDSGFLMYLLTIVFGNETLRKSCALGRKPPNADIAHDALDLQLLEFVKGM